MKGKWMTVVLSLALAAGLFGALPAERALAATCTSTGTGNWSASIWTCTPGSGDDVVIASGHTVTLDVDANVQGIAINSGGVFNNGSKTLTANAGYLTNNGAYNGDSGTYSFTAAGGVFGSSTTMFNDVTVSAGVDFKDGSNPTAVVNGMFTIKLGGHVSNDPPVYGSSSTLKYDSGGSYGRSLEWSTTSGAGYPANVRIGSSTVFDLSANGAAARQMSGNLTIDSGSSFGMGSMNDPNNLTVLGDVTIQGTLALSTGTANIYVGGNWTCPSSGTFTNNGSFVVFNGGDNQAISGAPSGTSRRFERIIVQNNSTVTFSNNVGVESGLNVAAGSMFKTNGTANFEQEVANSGPLDCDGTCTFNDLVVRHIDASGSTGSINVNKDFTINNAASSFKAPGPGVSFIIAGNFNNNITTGSFNANGGAITFNGTGTQTIGGAQPTSFFDIFLEVLSIVVVPSGANQPTVAGTVTNNGTLRQTKVVNNATVDFLNLKSSGGTDKYFGVQIITSNNLGSTTVSVSGNQICSQAQGYPVKRCFNVTPTTQAAANIKFYYQQNEMQTGQTYSSLNVWNYHGSAWNAVTRGADSGSCNSGAINCFVEGTGISTYSPFVLKNTDPTAVTLAEFYAAQQGDAVLVTWETASELNNRGFNLYRGVSPAGPDRQLNAALIPSQSQGNPGGFVYTWTDQADLTPGTTYFYWVEDVDLGGAMTMHGPVSVDFGVPTAVTLGSVSASPGLDTLHYSTHAAGAGALPTLWIVLAAGAALGAARLRRRG